MKKDYYSKEERKAYNHFRKENQRIKRSNHLTSIVDTKIMNLPPFEYEPVYCTTFGCGKILTLIETRYGNKCSRCLDAIVGSVKFK